MTWIGWFWWFGIVSVIAALIGSAVPESQENERYGQLAEILYSALFFIFLISAMWYAVVSTT